MTCGSTSPSSKLKYVLSLSDSVLERLETYGPEIRRAGSPRTSLSHSVVAADSILNAKASENVFPPSLLCRFRPGISVMQSADPRRRHYQARGTRSQLDHTATGRLLLQSDVGTILVVVADVRLAQSK